MVPRVLTRGLNSLPRDVVLLSQRSRVIEATAHFVSTNGDAATSVADIIGRAGVSRTPFYQQLRDKEDCYLSCYKHLAESHFKRMLAALEGEGTPMDRVVASVLAYLEVLAEDQEFSLAFYAEVRNAGERVRARELALKGEHRGHLQKWYKALREQQRGLVELQEAVFDLILDGSNTFLTRWVRDGFTPEVQKNICYFFFANLGLQAWAAEALQA